MHGDGLMFEKSTELFTDHGGHDIELVKRKNFTIEPLFAKQTDNVEDLQISDSNSSNEKNEQSPDKNEITNLTIELNSELETAVDLLKAEIWSLNQQIEQKTMEIETNLIHMNELERQNTVFNSNNDSLKEQLDSKEEQFCQVKQQLNLELEQIRQQHYHLEQQFSELKISAAETNMKLCSSDEHIVQLRKIICKIVSVYRDGLRELLTEQTQYSKELLESIKEINTHCQISIERVRMFLLLNSNSSITIERDQNEDVHVTEPARLVSKSVTNDALFQANTKLTEENVILQRELEEFKPVDEKQINDDKVPLDFGEWMVDEGKSKNVEATVILDVELCEFNVENAHETCYGYPLANEVKLEININTQAPQANIMTEQNVILQRELDEFKPVDEKQINDDKVPLDFGEWIHSQDIIDIKRDSPQYDQMTKEYIEHGLEKNEEQTGDENGDEWKWSDDNDIVVDEHKSDSDDEKSQMTDDWAWSNDHHQITDQQLKIEPTSADNDNWDW